MTIPTENDRAAIRAALLVCVTRYIDALTTPDLFDALTRHTDAARVAALAGLNRPPTLTEQLRALPLGDPYAILGDIVRTGGRVVPQSEDEVEGAFCVILPSGQRVVPVCVLDAEGVTRHWVDYLWTVACTKGWTGIRFFDWFTSPNPRIPMDATPLRYLEHHDWTGPAVDCVYTALVLCGEHGA